jgi:endonuclease YncB( thermonuclease family)
MNILCRPIQALVVLLAATAGVAADEGRRQAIPGPVPARVIEVIDGDTLVVSARIWIGQEVETLVRLAGVDAPEIRGGCRRERELARQARALIAARLSSGGVVLRDIHYGKYAGRVVARVETEDGEDCAGLLLAAGLGRPYAGGRRADWCGGDGN